MKDTDHNLPADTDLKKSHERFELAVRGTHDGIWDWDLESRDLYLSPRWKEQLGYGDDELPNCFETFTELLHPDDRPRVLAYLDRYLEGGIERFEMEFRLRHRDGSFRWVLSRGAALRDKEGRVHRMAGTHFDITERKHDEDELRKLTRAVEQSPVTIVITDIEGKIEYVNPKFTQTTGYTREEALGQNPRILKSGDLDEGIYRQLWQTVSAGGDWQGLFQNRKKNGERYWEQATISPVRSSTGEITHFLAVKEDITLRREAEQRFERLFRGNPALMAISSVPDRRFLDVNDAFIRTIGYTREEIIGRTVADLDLIPAIESQRHMADRLQKEGHIDGFELRVRCKDGTHLDGLFSGELITNQGKQFFLTVMVDITESKRAQAELEKSNRRLEKAIDKANDLAIQAQIASIAKSEFLANMSHEIRTPMNGVIGMTGLLLETNLDPDQRRFVEVLRSSGETLLNLINDILDYSKIEANRMKLEAHDFDLGALLQDLSESVKHRMEEKKLAYSCTIAPSVPVLLRGDSIRLSQILTNLLGNALKFTRAGEISVRVEPLDGFSTPHPLNDSTPKPLNASTPQPLNLSPPSVMLRFAIRDTGIGIPQDKIPLLFDKFSQVDASTTRQYGGTGLGLAISKQLTELMGGEIGIISPACPMESRGWGPGTEFWFTVRMDVRPDHSRPLVSAPDPSREVKEPLDFSHRSVRILLAEDNPTNQQVALGILKKFGLATDLVNNGVEAVEALSSTAYDLVLMDVQMPLMDGYEATRRIRELEAKGLLRPPAPQPLNPSTPKRLNNSTPKHLNLSPSFRLPIIAMTAHVMQGDRERCLEAGMDDYLAKPVLPKELRRMLDLWLPGPGTPNEDETQAPVRAADGVEDAQEDDWDRRDLMNRLMNDHRLARMVTKGFLEDMPRQIDRLGLALEQKDWPLFQRQAHSVKGASANLGAQRLRRLAQGLEEAAREPKEADLARGLADIRRLFEAVRPQMRAYIDDQTAEGS